VPANLLGVPGASKGEHLSLRLAPGRYTIDATVTDSATGLVTRGQVTVNAYRATVGASDLLLGTGLRAPDSTGDSVPRTGAGEIWSGALFVQTAGPPTLTPQESRLAYYLELYTGKPESVTVNARVVDGGGAQVIAAQPQRLGVSGGGGLTYGVLDLAGLPAGRYRLELHAQGPDSQVVRSASFSMSGFEVMGSLAQVAATVGDADVFSDKSEAGLDTMYQPLSYLMDATEQGTYSGLSLDGKRRWMRQFWAKRGNSERQQFYARVRDANQLYREGGASGGEGWKTDRGRIYVLNGPPDEKLERKNPSSANPYEVWKYTRTRLVKYVFLDLTRFGNYQLVYTNDRHEQSRPDWSDLLGADATQDVNDF
jgi:GWxTD domain-containing protein